MSKWSKDKYGSRSVKERIFVRGLLQLDTPTHFGGSETEGSTDMPLLYDAKDSRRPLLTGASIAGAIRNYLREYQNGYRWGENQKAKTKSWAEQLFGHLDDQKGDQPNTQRRQRTSVHSWLMVDDALGRFPDTGDPTEFREGVSIDPKKRTAEDGNLFDLELLSAGTTFPISFELWLDDKANSDLLEAFAIALHGLEQGEIGLGMRKRRGYGRCHVTGWQVSRYKMDNAAQIIDWLTHDLADDQAYQPDIYALLDVRPSLAHQGSAFGLQATFALDGSLFIRSYGHEKNEADAVHLQSWRKGQEKPVLPGTSLAGVLRARASKIANTLDKAKKTEGFIAALFGGETKDADGLETLQASRLLVKETVVEGGITNLVQNRVSIDRFTGGARDTALFNEQPVWSKPETLITIDLRLLMKAEKEESKKTEAEHLFNAQIGLLLLLLKDLWTGDLPLGGESSVGRGRLQGKNATLSLGETVWEMADVNGRLQFSGNGSQEELQNKYLAAFLEEMGHGS